MNSRLEQAYLEYDSDKDVSSLTRGDGGHRLASAVSLASSEGLSIEKLEEFYGRISQLGKDRRDTERAASIVGTYFGNHYGNDGKTPIFFKTYPQKRAIISELTKYAKARIKENKEKAGQ